MKWFGFKKAGIFKHTAAWRFITSQGLSNIFTAINMSRVECNALELLHICSSDKNTLCKLKLKQYEAIIVNTYRAEGSYVTCIS